MTRLLLLSCIALLTITGFYSCKKNKEAPLDLGYDYFPNKAGFYVVYDVDSLVYNNANLNPHTHLASVDTFRFQLKEKIESIYNDNLNRPTIRLERYIKFYNDTMPYSQMQWTFRNVWAENRTATTAEKVEENTRYVKLAFPVKDNQTWNGNAQNTQPAMNYTYAYYDLPIKIRTTSFDSVLQVTQFDDGGTISIQRQLYIEKYARNVGLVYKQIIDVQSQPYVGWDTLPYAQYLDSTQTFINTPILQRITGGLQFTMTVNSYGTE